MGFINNLIVRIKGDNKDLDKKLKQSQGAMGKFGSAVAKLGGAMAAAFALKRVVEFGKELFNLAAKAQGIEEAFYRIGNATLLQDLRSAVRGTVSDLELMRKAVQAQNFELPLESLSSLFAFAAKRAQQTGESVDYLVNSIVLGIGRKSPLILDNLGISAVRLRQELKGAGVEMNTVADIAAAVGRIATEEMSQSGDMIETAQVKVERLAASWHNAKRSLGEFLAESGSLTRELDRMAAALDLLNNKTLSFMEKVAIFKHLDVAEYQKMATKEQGKLGQSTIELVNAFGNLNGEVVKFLKVQEKARQGGEKHWQTLTTLGEKLEKLQEDLKNTNITHTGRIAKLNQEIQATKDLIAEIENLGKAESTPRTGDSLPSGTIAGITSGVNVAEPISTDTLRQMGLDGGYVYGGAFSEAVTFSMQQADFANVMQQMAQQAAQLMADVVENVFEAIGSGQFEGLGKDILVAFADFIGDLGKLLVAYGSAMLAVSLIKPFDPVSAGVAIGAGLAAIAIAGLIRGAVSSAGSATSGGGYSGASSGGGQSFQTQAMTIQVEGVLKGSDIAISSRRYSKDLTSKT